MKIGVKSKLLLEKLALQIVKNHKVQISTLLLPTAQNPQSVLHSVHPEAMCVKERVVSLQQMPLQNQEKARIEFLVESPCCTSREH